MIFTLIQAVENVCTCDMAHRLYNDLLTICEEQVRDVILPQLDNDACTFSGDQYLKTVATLWDTHCRQMVSRNESNKFGNRIVFDLNLSMV